ncbi:HD-GYP domain-containing protein [uncultured Devosia sp.]|uniref:HD-GYP domain-containing protein n=1 Tax=uncultured Devosia sp. TaxID=211434 RepID=UPI0035CC67A3
MALAKSLGADVMLIDHFDASILAGDPSVVFDLDLRRIDHVRKLKLALAQRGRGCMVFLTDPTVRVTSVHAAVLGADKQIPRPARASEIAAAIAEHLSDGRSEDAAVVQSIASGVSAIDNSFKAMIGNVELDTAEVLAVGEQIAGSIVGVGVEDWLATVKGHHQGTFQHCMLVTGVVGAFASMAGMAQRDVARLTVAGLLHDIGKAVVPLAILDKPGALNPQEQAVMRQHPVSGYDYLRARSDIDAATLRSVRHHHELLDGSGYPDGLSGRQIDDLTRIMTLCDIYAALVERRSYKDGKTPAQAMAILEAMAREGKLETSLVRELGRIMLPKVGAVSSLSR